MVHGMHGAWHAGVGVGGLIAWCILPGWGLIWGYFPLTFSAHQVNFYSNIDFFVFVFVFHFLFLPIYVFHTFMFVCLDPFNHISFYLFAPDYFFKFSFDSLSCQNSFIPVCVHLIPEPFFNPLNSANLLEHLQVSGYVNLRIKHMPHCKQI